MTTSLRGHANIWVGAPHCMSPPGQFCEHRHCDSGNIVVLIYHVTSGEQCLKGFANLCVEAPHRESPHSHVWWP